MKHLKNINEYFSNINEGVNYNNSVNADLVEIGEYAIQGSGKNPGDVTDEDLEKAAVEALKKAKPVSLTGDAKKDIPALVKYAVDAFKRCQIELDPANVEIDSSNFANELMIPVADSEYYFNTHLDYTELASNGSDFVIGGNFASDEDGALDYIVDDLSNQGDIVKACAEFKKYLESQG
jgi:hypothetical protein